MGTRDGISPAVIFDAILNQAPASPARLKPKVPEELARVITRLLEKGREFRYQSAAGLLIELKRLRRD